MLQMLHCEGLYSFLYRCRIILYHFLKTIQNFLAVSVIRYKILQIFYDIYVKQIFYLSNMLST